MGVWGKEGKTWGDGFPSFPQEEPFGVDRRIRASSAIPHLGLDTNHMTAAQRPPLACADPSTDGCDTRPYVLYSKNPRGTGGAKRGHASGPPQLGG